MKASATPSRIFIFVVATMASAPRIRSVVAFVPSQARLSPLQTVYAGDSVSRPAPAEPTAQFNVRLPVTLIRRVRVRAALSGRNPAAVVANAIRKAVRATPH